MVIDDTIAFSGKGYDDDGDLPLKNQRNFDILPRLLTVSGQNIAMIEASIGNVNHLSKTEN